MPYYYYIATSTEQLPFATYPRYHGWMMGGNWTGGSWAWLMYASMVIFNILIAALLVLAIIWFIKQIRK
ncbi:MAG: hypothetical protein A3I29_02910 [Candidatus Magasanikbacteria bacterium RIFCSPLOWO2_02_FULL_44_11]|uniref:Uncharacterized protein n=1 Tax=Candidatus Magasanikbacteria bacterium RIFCSPLOWO2_02_FULL_44_11 TaxID=1798689 RepID=A0A1F6NAH4_9BACT|nr:MAG: hypothetical protein A3I29_02910 [Candidatus Magasanikbacteria bacterium RIFCSPLOWO2_02_FULL_44_11]